MTENEARDPGPPKTAQLDAAEFATRFRRSFRSMWLIAVGITRDSAVAEDVVQDAAMIALGKLDAFTPHSNFAAWLGQIVRNVALNRARKERRSRTVAFAPETIASLQDHASHTATAANRTGTTTHKVAPDETETHEIDRIVLNAFDEVGDTARACLLLRTIEGWDYARISQVLEIPEGTAMSHVHRTRKRLRTLLTSDRQRTLGRGDHRA